MSEVHHTPHVTRQMSHGIIPDSAVSLTMSLLARCSSCFASSSSIAMAAEAAVARAAACPSALTRAASAATSDLLAQIKNMTLVFKSIIITANTTNTNTCQAAAAASLKPSLPEAPLPPTRTRLAERLQTEISSQLHLHSHIFPGFFSFPSGRVCRLHDGSSLSSGFANFSISCAGCHTAFVFPRFNVLQVKQCHHQSR